MQPAIRRLRLALPVVVALGLLLGGTAVASAATTHDTDPANASIRPTQDAEGVDEADVALDSLPEDATPQLTDRRHRLAAICERVASSDVFRPIFSRICDRLGGDGQVDHPYAVCRRAAQAEGLAADQIVERCRGHLSDRVRDHLSDHPLAVCRRAAQAEGLAAEQILERCREHLSDRVRDRLSDRIEKRHDLRDRLMDRRTSSAGDALAR